VFGCLALSLFAIFSASSLGLTVGVMPDQKIAPSFLFALFFLIAELIRLSLSAASDPGRGLAFNLVSTDRLFAIERVWVEEGVALNDLLFAIERVWVEEGVALNDLLFAIERVWVEEGVALNDLLFANERLRLTGRLGRTLTPSGLRLKADFLRAAVLALALAFATLAFLRLTAVCFDRARYELFA
jgi:hypothetical protein